MTQRQKVLQFRISLNEIMPAIWRRIQVPYGYSFWDLHVALQDAMGWKDCHLHLFRVSRPRGATVEIGIPDPDEPGTGDCLPGWKVPISRHFKSPGDEGAYEYDFGDDWQHTLLLEAVLLADSSRSYPRCLEGARACPPEDVGGVHGYQEFLEAFLNPTHPEHAAKAKWAGRDFNPEHFDAAAVRFDDPDERWELAFAEE